MSFIANQYSVSNVSDVYDHLRLGDRVDLNFEVRDDRIIVRESASIDWDYDVQITIFKNNYYYNKILDLLKDI